MFKKAKIEKAVEKAVNIDYGDLITSSNIKKEKTDYNSGIRTEKDFIAPSAISVIDPRTLLVGDSYVRSYVLFGYPQATYVGWLDDLYGLQGNADVTVKFEPIDAREATDTLTAQIAAYQSQLVIEQEKGKISNVTRYQAQIEKLVQQRIKIEQNLSNLLQCTIYVNLMSKSLESLDREAALLENRTKGRRIDLMASELQMIESFNACLPCLADGMKDKKRNFDTSAAVGCIPFYDSELSDENGIYLGINHSTGTPAYINFFGSGKMVENTNTTIFGRAGAGKSYLLSLIILRMSLKGVLTAIVDPEGEFHNITEALGGKTIKIGSREPGANINVFDIDEEEVFDDNGNPTGRVIVNVKEKLEDLVGIVGVMAKGEITGEQEALVSQVLQELYRRFGISEDPKSLYIEGKNFDSATRTYKTGGVKKKMPTFSDFHQLLMEYGKEYKTLAPLAQQLASFKKGGLYDAFDCESDLNLGNLKSIPVINFDIKELDSISDRMRPIGMYVVSSFIWDKFAKKLPGIQKRVVVDEAWLLLNKNMEGYEFTSKFLERLARRLRKRRGGLIVASQNLGEFISSSEGEAIINNAVYNIYLAQSKKDLEKIQDVCKITDGEKAFLTQAQVGDMLLKTEKGSSSIRTHSFPFEHELLTRRVW